MGRRRASSEQRIFVVPGDLACDDRISEIELRQVLTWRSEDDLRQRMTSGLPMTSKHVLLAETHKPLHVGTRLQVESDAHWLVRLGMDKPTKPLQAGDRLTQLPSTFVGSGGALVWQVEPWGQQRWEVEETKMGLALRQLG